MPNKNRPARPPKNRPQRKPDGAPRPERGGRGRAPDFVRAAGSGGRRANARGPRPGGHRSPPSQERMQELLERSGIQLSRSQLDRLWQFDQLLRRRNQDRDLTRLIEFESVVIKHYVDSMFVGQLIDLPSPLVDVGTGAGFPGIPLKIRYPQVDLTLAEQRPRRIQFLQEAIGTLGLSNTRTFKQRVVSRSFTAAMRGVITRAVEPIGKTMLRTSGCTRAGSLLIFMKGPGVDEELAEAKRVYKADYRLTLDRAYSLPHTPFDRRLVVFERLTDPVSAVAGDERLDEGAETIDADEEQELEG